MRVAKLSNYYIVTANSALIVAPPSLTIYSQGFLTFSLTETPSQMSPLLRHHSQRLRVCLQSIAQAQTITRPTSSILTTTPRRAYASKKAKHGQKKGNVDVTESALDATSSKQRARTPIATASLMPGSQQTLTDPTAREELARVDAKMATSVEWLRREVSQLEARASGRVTPQLLARVRVSAACSASDAKRAPQRRLEELATVGVREGTTLIVTVFDPQVRELWLAVLVVV